jgi:hypothetical protein
MAIFNDWLTLVAEVPRTLVVGWVAWLVTGALIVMWFRRAANEEPVPVSAPRPASKPKSTSRPASSPDWQSMETESHAAESHAHAAERPKGPVVIGDPFGDLATLLDQPAPAVATEYTPPPAGPPRAPAESPILSSSGSPMRRANSGDH